MKTKFNCGCIKDTYDERDHIKKIDLNSIPKKVALDNNDSFTLRDLAPEVTNQGSTSACGGFAAANAMYILMNKMTRKMGIDMKQYTISPSYIYWNARTGGDYSAKPSDSGCQLRDVMKALKNEGVVPDSIMPFSKYAAKKAPPVELIDETKNFKIKEYLRIPYGKDAFNTIKNVLSVEQLPIIIGLILYKEQMGEAEYSGYLDPLKDPFSASQVGGHAVCITGYFKKGEEYYLEFLNSWGKSFGDNGYCYFPASFLTEPYYVMDSWTVDKGYF